MASNVFIQRMFVTIRPLMETFAVQTDQKGLQVLLHATDFVTGNSSLRCDRLLKVIPGAVRWVLWFEVAAVLRWLQQLHKTSQWHPGVHPHHTQHSCALGSWKMRPLHCNIINSCTCHTSCCQSHLPSNNLQGDVFYWKKISWLFQYICLVFEVMHYTE